MNEVTFVLLVNGFFLFVLLIVLLITYTRSDDSDRKSKKAKDYLNRIKAQVLGSGKKKEKD